MNGASETGLSVDGGVDCQLGYAVLGAQTTVARPKTHHRLLGRVVEANHGDVVLGWFAREMAMPVPEDGGEEGFLPFGAMAREERPSEPIESVLCSGVVESFHQPVGVEEEAVSVPEHQALDLEASLEDRTVIEAERDSVRGARRDSLSV